MADDRLRIPQDEEYFHAIGLAVVAFARLEWSAIWCCERLEPRYLRRLRKKTANRIGEDLKKNFARVADGDLRARFLPLADEFLAIVEKRNGLFHGRPGTTPEGHQRLFRHGTIWTVEAVNKFADRCARLKSPLVELIHKELKQATDQD